MSTGPRRQLKHTTAAAQLPTTPWMPPATFVQVLPGVWEPEGYVRSRWEIQAPSVQTPQEISDEYAKCSADLCRFAFLHCWTLDVDDPSGIPQWRKFPAYPYLRRFFEGVQVPSNVHVEKSRQMLMSWAWMIVFLWDISFHDNWGNMALSRRQDEVEGFDTPDSLLGKIKSVWDALPPYLHEPLEFKAAMVRNPKNNSFVRGETGTVRAGRGRANKRALMDEAAYIPKGESIFKGLRQAAKNGTCLSSTPNGKGDVFARIRFSTTTTFRKYCTPAETPVWMSDYSFKPISQIRPGDKIIGWNDGVIGQKGVGRGRGQKRRVLVEATVKVVHHLEPRPVVKVTFASGRTLRCTPDHNWLQVKWGKLMAGNLAYAPARVGSRISHVVDVPAPCPPELLRTAAWLGGVYDGEGCSRIISQQQNANPVVYAEIERALNALRFDYTAVHRKICQIPSGRGPCGFYLNGDRSAMTRFVNWCQPVKRYQPKRGHQNWIFGSGFKSDEVVSIEPDGVEPVFALTTTTGNYVAWGYASKNSFHWSEHPRKAEGLYCGTCGWQAPYVPFPPERFFAHECTSKEQGKPPEMRSPWYDRECQDLTPEGVASELDISYEKSRRGRVFSAFDVTRHVIDTQVFVGERGAKERLDAYRLRYLRAVLQPRLPCFCTWDFGVGDPTSLMLGQVMDESTMRVRWIDEQEKNDASWEYFHGFVNGLWGPLVREITGMDLLHYGDPAGKQRASDLMSWVTNLRSKDPSVIVIHSPDRGSELEWIDFVHNIIRKGDFEVVSWCAHMIDALNNYHWPVDAEGNPVPGKHMPVHDANSHVMSSFRYAYTYRWWQRLPDINSRAVGAKAILRSEGQRPPDEGPGDAREGTVRPEALPKPDKMPRLKYF